MEETDNYKIVNRKNTGGMRELHFLNVASFC